MDTQPTDQTRPVEYETPAKTLEGRQDLAADLQRLVIRANGGPMSLGDLLATLADRGSAVAIILLSAPFVVIPIPGISTAVGGVVLALSIAVMLGSSPWLPKFIRNKSVSFETLSKLVNGSNRVLNKLGKWVHPRLSWFATPGLQWFHGISLVAATIALMLPIPIPMNNAPPAIAILLLALGLVERDGLMLLIGHIYTWLMWIALIVVGVVFWSAVSAYVYKVFGKIAGLFS
jgi:hypothetical protein